MLITWTQIGYYFLNYRKKYSTKSDRNIFADLAKVTKKSVILTILASFV